MERRLTPRLEVFPDAAGAAAALAAHLVGAARSAVAAHGRFRWVLSGGHTPAMLYGDLRERFRSEFPWADSEVYFGDERCVPPDSSDSNYAMARRALLDGARIPPSRVHRIPGEVRPIAEAARQYERVVGPLPALDAPPRFDVVLLGIGPDGHTASLFPGTAGPSESLRTVIEVPEAPVPPLVPRITMTAPALSSTDEVCFLVSGPDKQAPVAATLGLAGGSDPRLPASLVRPRSSIHWYLDRAAAPSGT